APVQLIATPQRAALRSSTFGIFRSLSNEGSSSQNETHQSQKTHSPEASISSSSSKGHSKTHSLARDEWENARMDELSQEIRKLLGSSSSSAAEDPPQPVDADADADADFISAAEASKPLLPKSSSSWSTAGKMPVVPESESVLDGLDISQPLNIYRVPDGIMQVFIKGIHPSNPVNRPYVVVRLGDQVFQTSIGKTTTGNWNEGFELIVSYHMQLFGTVHLDVYSSNTLLPDTLIGRAEIKLSLLEGFPEIFTSYYEIWDKKLAASTVPEQRQRQVISKNLGALQVRINYRFQKLEDPEPKVAKVRGAHIVGTVPTQLVNKIASLEDPSSSTDLSVEDLVAAFANEYNQYMNMVHATASWPHLRNSQSNKADAAKSTVGFAKVDDDAAPPAGQAKNQANGSVSSSSGWFSDLLAGVTSAGPTAKPDTVQASDMVDKKEPANSAGTSRPGSAGHKKSETITETATKAAAETAATATTAAIATAAADKSANGKNSTEKTLIQSLTSMFISPSIFMALKSLDRLAGAFNQGVELSNTELLGGLFTLYKLYNEAEIPGVTRPHRGQIIDSAQGLEVPGRYARFALASYGWRALYFFNRGITLMDGVKMDSDVTSVLQYLGLAPEDLLGYEFRSSQLFCPSYFVAYDRQYDAVVLVVRGTMSVEDAVVDLSCEYSKWNGGLVHSGMKSSAHWLFVNVMPLILAYAKSHNIRRIRIVGHSLGGSTAAILTIMVQSVRDRLGGLGIDSAGYDIKGFCFGPAPCISEEIADKFKDCIDTFVNNDDLVPRLCYGSVSDFKRLSISAADESDNLAQRLYAPFEDTAAQQQRWKERFERLLKIREDIIATQENLHLVLPGVTYHIISYRNAASKGKKEMRDADMDIAIGRRELFESGNNAEAGSGLDNGSGYSKKEHNLKQNPLPPPPTPDVKVRADSVDPKELADAISTTIDKDIVVDQPKQSISIAANSASPAAAPGGLKVSLSAAAPGHEKFYPVWVQKVPSSSFREIILRPTIITDHMPSAYESAFARAIETQIREKRLRDKRRRSSTNNTEASGSSSSSSSSSNSRTNLANK
ncbi:hypothetical protein J3B02_003067, partial [Coemansia erecta]